MNKEKIITIIAALTLTVLLTAVVLVLLGKRQVENYTSTNIIPTVKPKLPYSLSLEPQNIIATAGAKIKLNLKVSAYGEDINGLDAVLAYDKKYLKPAEIVETSDRFLVPRKMIGEERVILTALKKLNDDNPISDEVIAEIYFTALNKGKTEVSFEFYPGKTIGSTIIKANGSLNILSEVKGTRVEIN